jgi:hypothetical protein
LSLYLRMKGSKIGEISRKGKVETELKMRIDSKYGEKWPFLFGL